MESRFPVYFSIIALLVPVIFLIIHKWKKSKDISSVKLPPGPKKLPIIGDLHNLSGLPFHRFRDLAKQYGPIMHLELGQVSTIVVSSPEMAKEVLKVHDLNFAERQKTIAKKIMWYNCSDIGFSPYGDYWRQMRKTCVVELLSATKVRSFSSIRNDEFSHMIEAVRASCGKPINLTETIYSTMSYITCKVIFGNVYKNSQTLTKLMRDAFKMADGFQIADLFPSSNIINTLSWGKLRLVMMRRKLDLILDDIINKHKENQAKMAEGDGDFFARRGNGKFGDEDLVDAFLRIKETGGFEFPIGNDNIKAVIYDMFSGGTETSSTAVVWTLAELMKNPRVMTKAQAEVRQVFKESKIINENDLQKLKYLKLVIMETLRLHPPVPIIPRAAREECEISGYTIPAKAKVLVNYWAIQRDPKYWTNPESFEPERFENQTVGYASGDFQYMPFGSGKRSCPGKTFGLVNAEVALAQLLYSFNWKLPEGVKAEALNMIESPGITASRKDDLYVVATSYESVA